MSGQVTGIAADGDSSSDFGANEWLVDEMYAKYLEDKNLVDEAWWPFLENYQPSQDSAPTTPAPSAKPTDAPAAAPAKTPAAPQPASAATPAAPSDAPAEKPFVDEANPSTGSQPVARTTSIEPKPQPG